MADEVRIEHTLGWRDRVLLTRMVLALEKFLLASATPEVREELSREIAAMAKDAEAVAKAQEPHQGA